MRQHVCVSPLKSFLTLPCYLCSRAAGIPAVQSVSTAKTPSKIDYQSTQLSVPGPVGKTQNWYIGECQPSWGWRGVKTGFLPSSDLRKYIFIIHPGKQPNALFPNLCSENAFIWKAIKLLYVFSITAWIKTWPPQADERECRIPPPLRRIWIMVFSLALSGDCLRNPPRPGFGVFPMLRYCALGKTSLNLL